MSTTSKWLIATSVAALAVAGGLYATKAKAADLGGSCCADLEERVAELEATVARKGNRKVRLVVSGQVSKAVLWHDIPGLAGENKLRVIDNANSGTRIRFAGESTISKTMRAGFIVELGYDETKGTGLGISSDDMTIRHSFAWLETAAGKVSIGRTSSATDGIAEIDTSNANIASLPMSLEPLWTYSGLGGIAGGILNPVPFDGGRANVVAYETPNMGGFIASAAWGGGQTASGDDLWDVALRYANEFGGVRVAAGIGYRVENYDTFGATDETKTLAGSASIKHVLTGLFVTGAFGDQKDNPLFGDMQMWQARAGIERNWTGMGATTLFAEYGDHTLKTFDIDSSFVGLGIVQQIDAAAMDLFVSYRQYDISGFDVSTGMAGVRIKF